MHWARNLTTLAAFVGGLAAMGAGVSPAMAVDCPIAQKPVCAGGSDGSRVDFADACPAERKGYTVLHAGRCEAPGGPRTCSSVVSATCAIDPQSGRERTYPNLCSAELARAVSVHDGACALPKPGG